MKKDELRKYEGGIIQHVGKAINVTNKLLLSPTKKKRIIHLDDHRIITDFVKNCLESEIKELTVIAYRDSDSALSAIENDFENNQTIDMIITDFSHPGLCGYDFAKAVRGIEIKHDKRTTILLFTLHGLGNTFIGKGLEEGIFDKYLSLSVGSDELIEYVKICFIEIKK